jgi:transposase InsO family protein
MPWSEVTVSEQRENFIRDYRLGYYSVKELAERFGISRKTAYKWLGRWEEGGRGGLADQSRRPHGSPWQTGPKIRDELLRLRRARPNKGPKKLLDRIGRQHPDWNLPAVSTAAHILSVAGLVQAKGRGRRAHPGCPKSVAREPNDIWAADYKGQFRLKNGAYCYPLTVSDLHSRYLLGCQGHEEVSLERSRAYFELLFRSYGLPARIRTDNGVPFASNALARLSTLSVWWIKLGIYPELIEPGCPQQNGIHERMHRTLKAEATVPPSSSMRAQQRRFDSFRAEFNGERPHEALEMKYPAEVYRPSARPLPARLEQYEYPAHFQVRRVSRAGTIRMHTKQFFLSSTLDEEYVGLEEVDDGIYDLYFCFYQIGRYCLRKNRVEAIISKVPLSVGHDLEAPRRVSPMSPE